MKTTKKRRLVKSTGEQWRDIIAEWATSDLSDDDFCKRENYSIEAFRYWQKQLKGEEPDSNGTGQESPSPFVPLRVVVSEPKQQQVASQPPEVEETRQSISILVPGGAVIKVDDCNIRFIIELYSSLKSEVQPC